MGKRGPVKTPTAMLSLRGSRLVADRTGEPKPDATPPPCPDTLDEACKGVWDQVTEQLAAMGTLAISDANAIERYCRLFVEWRNVQAFIDRMGHGYALYLRDKNGQFMYDDNGQKILRCRIQHPEVGVRNKLNVDLLRLEQNFGLTPAGRAGLTVQQALDIDPMTEMLMASMERN